MLFKHVILPSLKIEQSYTMQEKQIREWDYKAIFSLLFTQYGNAFF